MNRRLLMDTALLAGEIMLQSGAETYRVEDTMCHILKTSGCERIEAFALMTGIMASISDEDMEQPITIVKNINDRTTNLNNIIKVNEISRRYCGGSMTLEQAYEKLLSVKEKQYNRTIYNLATAACAGGFAMMLGGKGIDILTTFLMGFWLAGCITLQKIFRINVIFMDIISCAGIALMTLGVKTFLLSGLNMDIVIASAIMPIVPGVAITHAIRDTLYGDYLSGCARVLEAFLKAASIAVGVGMGLGLFNLIVGGGIL